MKIQKEYSFFNGRQIWRLIPTESAKIIIEERNVETKEVFFNCLDINTGENILSNLQLEEKFWIGIETVYKDIIYFHKYIKPDMPRHKGITAYDMITKKVLWNNEDYTFLFVSQNKLYTYQELFEGRQFYSIDYRNGNVVEDLKEDAAKINELREETIQQQNYEGYYFTEYFDRNLEADADVLNLVEEIKSHYVITGKIEFIKINNLLLLSFYEISDGGYFDNIFLAIDISNKKIILEEKLNTHVKAFIPDSFFVKDNLIFLLKEKEKLDVCSIRF